ncbi:hypothetical protein BU25DRAFT_3229 [Macroventuria anomochaeta]|uniref:Uncharacterized protein n=1 Tax=Macroventuria anomochaeta TaxID=301207 RepID=A0ACB6SJ97_9PLEO|nr:uncharacterized protein BU25DRAFT_3229 [Macroventuria anomochaeta]KAF2633292.1 hypothetical protein BU25DRAFT_3229 [Macroventuria anomochaeta]
MPTMLSLSLRKALTDQHGPWHIVYRYLRCTFPLFYLVLVCAYTHDCSFVRFCGCRHSGAGAGTCLEKLGRARKCWRSQEMGGRCKSDPCASSWCRLDSRLLSDVGVGDEPNARDAIHGKSFSGRTSGSSL